MLSVTLFPAGSQATSAPSLALPTLEQGAAFSGAKFSQIKCLDTVICKIVDIDKNKKIKLGAGRGIQWRKARAQRPLPSPTHVHVVAHSHDHVDPQQLQHVEGRHAAVQRTHGGRDHGHQVDGQLEYQELWEEVWCEQGGVRSARWM